MTPMPLQTVTTVGELRTQIQAARQRGLSVGLVPTMGALHEGHASLVRQARLETGYVVVTIFVNPTQFGPNEDLDRYPRQLAQDTEICRRERADLLFVPSKERVYPPGFTTYVEVHGLQAVLCGQSRPHHFRGVATVVAKLFNMVQPDIAYFGQKDAQQVRILQQMVRDLNFPVEIRVCPTVREADGLAMSSRNAYLTPEQRSHATVLHRALQLAQEMVRQGESDPGNVIQTMKDFIHKTPGAELDYAEVVDYATLQPATRLQGELLIALAVKFGTTRLIDNVMLRL
jgi:pantoate--beta-alanine ligase